MADDPYREFEEAMTDVLAEKQFGVARHTRLWKARGAVDRIDPRHKEAVYRAERPDMALADYADRYHEYGSAHRGDQDQD
jgi:hypothetical protein